MNAAPVTVVMPLYNAARFVGDALATVRTQAPRPAEVIVIDDGSIDDGAAIVAAADVPGLTLIRQANRGVAAARNAGLGAASSPLIAFLDADDLWCPGHLASLVALAERFPDAAILGARFRPAPATATAADAEAVVQREGTMRRADVIGEAAAGSAPFYTSSCMVRRDVARAEGGFPEGHSHGEDLALWYRLSERHGAAATDRVGALYRRAEGGLTGRSVRVPDIAMLTLDALGADATPQRRAVMAALRTRLALAHALDAVARGDRPSARAALA
ncbi:glycosyltransferase family A protein, partial [Elioraea sp.]|uniref:glycosyltransferase family 2 protein n=1 Tax=Elioraea sp. TaxID=2185103 RepID=UPI0025C1C2CB